MASSHPALQKSLTIDPHLPLSPVRPQHFPLEFPNQTPGFPWEAIQPALAPLEGWKSFKNKVVRPT